MKAKRTIALSVLGMVMVLGAVYMFLVYQGYIFLNCPSRKQFPVTGVDVSHYQGTIDWPVLSEQGIQFAYIKATEGSSHVDERFAENWKEARETKLRVGAYHFFSFDSPGEAQAENFIAQVELRQGMLPPVADVEYYGDKKENPPQAQPVREQLRIFLDCLEEYYQMTPIIYCTEEVWEAYLDGYFASYPLWIRNVYTKPGISEPWTFWQYTNRGRLKGYSGEEKFIDLNVFCGDEEEWESRWEG